MQSELPRVGLQPHQKYVLLIFSEGFYLPIDSQMSSSTHHERDLAIGRHAVMAEAFELLADHLGPFIDDRMGEYFPDEPSWAEAAANRLGRPAEHGATDPLFQLLVLRRFWGPVFADFYGQDLRQIIGQLIETRNMWAHFSFPHDPEALQRSVLAIERLLAPVEPGITGRLRRLRSRVNDPDRDIDAMESSEAGPLQLPAGLVEVEHLSPLADTVPIPSRPPPTAKPVPDPADRTSQAEASGSNRARRRPSRRRDDVNVKALEAQLAETELVFRELQDQYGDLKTELDDTRRMTASKQLRLTAVEQRLLEAEGHTSTIEEHLKKERLTRNSIEWLIVSLIATLLLFMVLANAF